MTTETTPSAAEARDAWQAAMATRDDHELQHGCQIVTCETARDLDEAAWAALGGYGNLVQGGAL